MLRYALASTPCSKNCQSQFIQAAMIRKLLLYEEVAELFSVLLRREIFVWLRAGWIYLSELPEETMNGPTKHQPEFCGEVVGRHPSDV